MTVLPSIQFGAIKPYGNLSERDALINTRQKNGTQFVDLPAWLLNAPALQRWNELPVVTKLDGFVLSSRDATEAAPKMDKLRALYRAYASLDRLNALNIQCSEATHPGYERLLSPARNDAVRTAIMEQLQAEAGDLKNQLKALTAKPKASRRV